MSGRGRGDFADAKLTDSDLVEQVAEKFKVDKKTAEQIINFAVCMAIERMGKWKSNIRKLQKTKAEEIYSLIKAWKKREKSGNISSASIIDNIESKILELCVEHE